MKRLSATKAGTTLPNQDRAGTSGRLLWVIDGTADPTDPQGPADFAQGLTDALAQIGYRLETEDPDDVALDAVLAEAIATNPERTNGSSAAVALSFHGRDRTEMLVLGDARALAFRPAQDRRFSPVILRDSRIGDVATDQHQAFLEAVRRGEEPQVVQCLQRELHQARKQLLNHPDGFWAAADDPAVAVEAVTASLPHRNPLLLATQGVPGLFGGVPARLFAAYDNQALADILDELHARVAERGAASDMAIALAAPHDTPRFISR